MTTLWDDEGKAWNVDAAECTVRNRLFNYLSFKGDKVQSGTHVQSGVWRNRVTRMPELDGVIAAGEAVVEAKPEKYVLDLSEKPSLEYGADGYHGYRVCVHCRPIADEVPAVPSESVALSELIDAVWKYHNERNLTRLGQAAEQAAAVLAAGEIGEKEAV